MEHAKEILKERIGQNEDGGKFLEVAEREFRKYHDEPPIEELEAVLQESFNEERARKLIFEPDEGSTGLAKYYPLLICSPPQGAPREHPQYKLQAVFLTMFHMIHVFQPKVEEEFVLRGGLTVLANLVADGNLTVRAQALESLLAITGSEDLDWFKDPPDYRCKRFHPFMLQLSQHNLIASLIRNYEDSFPGGSFLALRILAFYLSWVRLFYCKDNILRVSRSIISTLLSWSERTDLSKEETSFAKQLYDDFRRFPVEGISDEGSIEIDTQQAPLPEVEDVQPSASSQASLSYKAQGNHLFAEGKYIEALQKYLDAISASDNTNAVADARIHGNIGAANMELWKGTNDPQRKKEHLEECIKHSLKALTLDDSYSKAHYRLAQAYIEIGEFEKASETVRIGKSSAQERDARYAFEKLETKLEFLNEKSEDRRNELELIYKAILERELGTERYKKEIQKDAQNTPIKEVTRDYESKDAGGSVEKMLADLLIESKPPAPPTTMHSTKKKEASIRAATEEGKTELKKKVRLIDIRKLDQISFIDALLPMSVDEIRGMVGDNLDENFLTKSIDAADSLLPSRSLDALHILNGISQANRFSLVLMFLTQKVRDRLPSMFAIMKSAVPEKDFELVKTVCTKFE